MKGTILTMIMAGLTLVSLKAMAQEMAVASETGKAEMSVEQAASQALNEAANSTEKLEPSSMDCKATLVTKISPFGKQKPVTEIIPMPNSGGEGKNGLLFTRSGELNSHGHIYGALANLRKDANTGEIKATLVLSLDHDLWNETNTIPVIGKSIVIHSQSFDSGYGMILNCTVQ